MKFKLAAALILSAGTVATTYAQDGESTYKANCQVCHAATGAADTPTGKMMGARSFFDPEIAKDNDAQWIAVIKNGKGKMPPFARKLSDDQIKSVVKYIRTLKAH